MTSGLSILGVIAAAIAGFAFGAIYYTALARPWVEATGKSEQDLRGPQAANRASCRF